MARMGFSDEDIRSKNPRIVYVSISGFGEAGPYADQQVYDPVIQALSGATDIQADRLTGKPTMFRVIIADKVASLTASQAISSALYHRERSEEGRTSSYPCSMPCCLSSGPRRWQGSPTRITSGTRHRKGRRWTLFSKRVTATSRRARFRIKSGSGCAARLIEKI